MQSLLFATTNQGKLNEARELAVRSQIELIGIHDLTSKNGTAPEVIEDAADYYGNALLKAKQYAQWARVASFADDTGLEVAALNGEPGILSARYAGDHAHSRDNVTKLLHMLHGVVDRRASFLCQLVFYGSNQEILSASGSLDGEIALETKGDGGFGYDNIFYLPEIGLTLAEVKAKKIPLETHRIKALKQLFDKIIFNSTGSV